MEDDSERRYNEMKEDFLSQCNNEQKRASIIILLN